MEKNLSFVEKLAKVQTELKAPKNRTNSFGGYKYRNCEDILEAVKPLCKENGLMLMLSDEPVVVGDWHYVKATATITDGVNNSSVSASARESATKKGMDDAQVSGAASSYARKYALNGLFLIDDAADADTNEYTGETNLEVHSLNAIKNRLNQAVTKKMDEGFSVKEIAQLTGVGQDEEDVRDIIRMIGKIDTFEKKLKGLKK